MIRFAFIVVLITGKTIDAQISLEYKPTLPFYHPKPGNHLSQIVPPGKPWPANQAGYSEFSQTTKLPMSSSSGSTTPPPPGLVDRFKEDGSTAGMSSSTTEKQEEAFTSLEYKPNLPSFHPKPGNNIGQIVGPGKPWPSNAAGYEEFSQTSKRPPGSTSATVAPPSLIHDRFEEVGTTAKIPASISLEYVPNQPFYYNPTDYIAHLKPTTAPPSPPNLQDRFNAEQEHKKKIQFLESLFIKTDGGNSENSNESVPGSEVNVPPYFYYPAVIPYLIPPYPYPYSFVFYK